VNLDWNQRTDTVNIRTLRKGDVFQCISNKWWRVVRHADNGVTHVEGFEANKPELFAGCATVIPKMRTQYVEPEEAAIVAETP